MHQIRGRKAFTLIELIIVIVILGILAGIAIVGYQAVINRAKEAKVDQAAESFDRAFRALAAFDSNYTAADAHLLIEEMADAGDTPDIDAVLVAADDAAGTLPAPGAWVQLTGAVDVDAQVARVTFTEDGTSVCLTLATSANTPGTFADGACA